jgi:S-adenosylmethionine hydrolase
MSARIITLLTDFGASDGFVGIMKGVILGINPDVRLIDLTHAVPPQQTMPAALVLRSAVGAFPDGTIHLVVVDPGVGSARRPIVIETDAGFLIGPDNGVLSLAANTLRRRIVRVIENPAFFRHPVSHTFHGRDVFAPAAAHLSRGVPAHDFGPAFTSIVELAAPAAHCSESAVSGQVVYVDHFGNLVTNVDANAITCFPGRRLSVSISGRPVVGPVTAYAAVPEGALLAIVGSWGMLEIAVRNGNAAGTLAAGPGTPVTVVVESRDA